MKKYFTALLLPLISSAVCAEIIDVPMSQSIRFKNDQGRVF